MMRAGDLSLALVAVCSLLQLEKRLHILCCTCQRSAVCFWHVTAVNTVQQLLASSFLCRAGIGKSLAKKLASQGVNVVLVALQDRLLDDTHAELQQSFPELEFRKVKLKQADLSLVV